MNLYDFYNEILNEKLLKEFTKLITESEASLPPIQIKKKLLDKLNKAMQSSSAPQMSEMDKRVQITVTRFRPADYKVRAVYGVNKMFVVVKYVDDTKSFSLKITDEGILKPKVDI